jgi:hypothetical protein
MESTFQSKGFEIVQKKAPAKVVYLAGALFLRITDSFI